MYLTGILCDKPTSSREYLTSGKRMQNFHNFCKNRNLKKIKVLDVFKKYIKLGWIKTSKQEIYCTLMLSRNFPSSAKESFPWHDAATIMLQGTNGVFSVLLLPQTQPFTCWLQRLVSLGQSTMNEACDKLQKWSLLTFILPFHYKGQWSNVGTLLQSFAYCINNTSNYSSNRYKRGKFGKISSILNNGSWRRQ